MIGAVARKLFGSANERRIRSYLPRVREINELEKELEALSDDALKARTEELAAALDEDLALRRVDAADDRVLAPVGGVVGGTARARARGLVDGEGHELGAPAVGRPLAV